MHYRLILFLSLFLSLSLSLFYLCMQVHVRQKLMALLLRASKAFVACETARTHGDARGALVAWQECMHARWVDLAFNFLSFFLCFFFLLNSCPCPTCVILFRQTYQGRAFFSVPGPSRVEGFLVSVQQSRKEDCHTRRYSHFALSPHPHFPKKK